MDTTHHRILLPALLAASAAAATLLALAATAPAKMVSQKIAPKVCQTTGGGRFVSIPDFPGERIDQRLLPDIAYLEQRYKIFVTDGLSDDPVHAANGEHPIGLAVDIVPDTAAGGTWRDVSALAKLAEPSQDNPVPPFRWVGYNGDAGHGRGHHLHLSWNHSDARPGVPARTVDTMICPTHQPRKGGAGGGTGGGGNGAGSGTSAGGGKAGNGGSGGKKDPGSPSGGVGASGGGGSAGGSGPSSGGVGRLSAELERQARHPVIETGGVGFGDR